MKYSKGLKPDSRAEEVTHLEECLQTQGPTFKLQYWGHEKATGLALLTPGLILSAQLSPSYAPTYTSIINS